MEYSELRTALIVTAIELNASGVNQGTSGNLSVRVDDGFLITPSGMQYSALKPEDIVFMKQSGEHNASCNPSSEWRFHRDIYTARNDAGAIVHTHSVHATALACLNRGIPAFHYMVAVAGGHDIRCAPYATYGTQALSQFCGSGIGRAQSLFACTPRCYRTGQRPKRCLSICLLYTSPSPRD